MEWKKWSTESAAAAVVEWSISNTHIEWSSKKKIKNKISKVEVPKSENFQSQKMFENFLSVWKLGLGLGLGKFSMSKKFSNIF